MQTMYAICMYLLVALGTGHTLLTPIFYPTFSADALWFAGTGLSLLFLGLLNIVTERISDRNLRNLCMGANIVGTIFIILVTVALPEFQAFLAVAAVLGTTIGSITTRHSPPRQTSKI
jgi:hypothetical protein